MGETTQISWADRTWSPWIGCTKVSPACDGCYAAHLMDTRLGRVDWGGPGKGAGTRSRTSEPYRRQLYAWDREAKAAGVQLRTFPSLCDPFDNEAPLEWLAAWLDDVEATPNLIHLALTKRPQNAKARVNAVGRTVVPPNMAIGATMEDRKRVAQCAPWLCNPGAVVDLKPAFLFASCEPLLEDIADEIAPYLGANVHHSTGFGWISWVITGGETDQGDHKARPSHPQWFRNLRDASAVARVAYHHKQNGEWMPICWMEDGASDRLYFPPPKRDPEGRRRCKVDNTVMNRDGTLHPSAVDPETYRAGDGSMLMFKVGKNAAGRLLDGREHNDLPAVAPPARSAA